MSVSAAGRPSHPNDEGLRRKGRRALTAASLPGLFALALIGFVATAGPALVPQDPLNSDLASALEPPVWLGGGWTHPLGTDELGRDVLSRAVSGTRTSVLISLAVVAVAGVAGTAAGLVAGYAGGRLDAGISTLVDIFAAIPGLVLAVAVAGALEQRTVNLVAAIAFVSWPVVARLVRGETMRAKASEFVLAARAVGCSDPRIALRHVLPSLAAPLAVLLSLQVSTVLAIETALSFLRVGVPPPAISWGLMLADGKDYIGVANTLVLVPALAIVGTSLAINTTVDAFIRGRSRG